MGLPSEIITGLIGSSGYSGYEIDQSAVFDGSSDYLSWTPPSQGDTRTFTISCLVRRFNGEMIYSAGTGTSFIEPLSFTPNDKIRYAFYNGSTYAIFIETDAVFRDYSSWYHIVLAVDTTAATASDRVKIWVNGVLQSVDSSQYSGYGSQNTDLATNRTNLHNIAKYVNYTAYGGLGIADFRFIDGQAYEATDFGEFYNGTTAWRAIEPSGLTYGTNGFYLPFTQDTPNLGVDYSGNGNDWTENGSPVQSSDSPTVNYATLNALEPITKTLSNGNRTLSIGSDNTAVRSTVALPTSGKWYWEAVIDTPGYISNIGIANDTFNPAAPGTSADSSASSHWYSFGSWFTSFNSGVVKYATDGAGSSGTNWSGAPQPSAADVLMVAYDADNGKIWFGRNGSWISSGGTPDPAAGDDPRFSSIDTEKVWFAAFCGYSVGPTKWTARFAEDEWTYTAPTDFVALSAANLPEVTITDPGEYFNAVGYTGTAATGNAVTGVGFQPDFTWQKKRNGTGAHVLTDVIRGVDKQLFTNLANGEQTSSLFVESFDSDGFTVGSNASGTGDNNFTSGSNYISWNWKAGGAGVPNTDGTISSTVSVNDDAGFSIVKLASADATGASATLGHGLSAPPELIIGRPYSTTSSWPVYHKDNTSAPETDRLLLDTTGATVDDNRYWDDFVPTSTVFGVNSLSNISSQDSIFYCFRSIPGYSKVFSYPGNGSPDGPFVWLGFKPRFILLKLSSAAQDWLIYDTARDVYNESGLVLRADSSAAEYDGRGGGGREIDILSNGFKIRTSNGTFNASSATGIGIAFAENPFGGSNLPLALAR